MKGTPTLVNPKNLFTEVSEGDEIMFGDRDEPITIYRHVTEDDLEGQVITMSEVTEDAVKSIEYDLKHNPGLKRNTGLSAGDLLTGELTGDEFLIARGPRGGCYLLTQWWSKNAGEWNASIALYRRTRKDNEVWSWENVIDVERVGKTEVDCEKFDAGGHWVRHTELDECIVWSNGLEGEAWEHSEALTGQSIPEIEESPIEILETVSEGDTVGVNDFTPQTVTEVVDQDDGPLADGSRIKFDGMMVQTFTGKGKAMYRTEDGDDGDVVSVTVV